MQSESTTRGKPTQCVYKLTSASPLGIAKLYYRGRNSLELSLKMAAKAINNKRKLESLLIRLTFFG